MQKNLTLSMIALLVISTFAMAFAIADESTTIEDAIATQSATSGTDVISEATTTNDLAIVADQTESIAPTLKATQQRYAGIARVTLGDGFAVNAGNTEAESVLAYWVSARYISVDPSIVKNLTKQYKGQPEQLRAELAKLATDKVVLKASGQLSIGFGNLKEKFKLLKKEFTNTSASFYVLPINTNLAELRDATDEDINAKAVGILKLDAIVYPHLTLWKGTLTLNSGSYADTWTVTANSQSKMIAKGLLKKEAAAVKATVGQGNKIGLLQRLMFWRKATA